MDWKSIAGKIVAAGGPVIGGAIGGPAGGAIGSIVGGMVAKTLGVDATPEAVSDYADSNPAGFEEAIKSVESDYGETVRRLAEIDLEQIRIVNETMRDEGRGPMLRWIWRPLNGISLVVESQVFVWTIAILLFRNQIEAINAIAGMTGLIIAYLGARGAVVGASAWGRTLEKKAGVP